MVGLDQIDYLCGSDEIIQSREAAFAHNFLWQSWLRRLGTVR